MMITYTGIILILLFASILILQRRQASSIHKRSQIIYNSDINSFIALQSRIMEQIVYDYTYWDEFAEELERGISQKWLNENITTLLDAYDFCYVAVYDKNYQLIYESSTDSLNLTKIVPKEALESISEVKSGHFFIESENSFLEISSGAVRPVSALDKKTINPSGYLVLAQNWNESFLEKISSQFNSEYHYTKNTEPVHVKSTAQTVAPYYYYDWKGEQIGKVWFIRNNPLCSLYNQSSLYMLVILLLSLVFLWFTLRYSIKVWVLNPLRVVADILRTESFSDIAVLKKAPVEFAQLAILLRRYISQKEELKKEKERAEKADLLKTQFIANMSHEIRTPMNSIIGFTELLKEPDISDKDKELYIDIIQSNGSKMIGIINSLINISRLEAGQEPVNISPVSFREVASNIQEFFNADIAEKGLTLKCTTITDEQGDVIINTDREKLNAIISNIIHNAIKYSSEGTIECSYIIKGDMAEFIIKDQGIGIDPEHTELIFDRFYQVESQLNRKYEGVGLGLAIAKAYTELLGGSIRAESEPGIGSAFYITIPVN